MDGNRFIEGGATLFGMGMLLFALHFIFGGQSNFIIFGIGLMVIGGIITAIGVVANNR